MLMIISVKLYNYMGVVAAKRDGLAHIIKVFQGGASKLTLAIKRYTLLKIQATMMDRIIFQCLRKRL